MSERVEDLQADGAEDVRGGGPPGPYPPTDPKPDVDVASPPMDRIDPAVRPGELTDPIRPASDH